MRVDDAWNRNRVVRSVCSTTNNQQQQQEFQVTDIVFVKCDVRKGGFNQDEKIVVED